MIYKSLIKSTANNWQSDIRQYIPAISPNMSPTQLDAYVAQAEEWIRQYIGDCLYNQLATKYKEVCTTADIKGDGARWTREAIEYLQKPIALYTASVAIVELNVVISNAGPRTQGYDDYAAPPDTATIDRLRYNYLDRAYDALEAAIDFIGRNSQHFPEYCACDSTIDNWAARTNGLLVFSPKIFHTYYGIMYRASLVNAGRLANFELLLPQLANVQRFLEKNVLCSLICPLLRHAPNPCKPKCSCSACGDTDTVVTIPHADTLLDLARRYIVYHALHDAPDLYTLTSTPYGYRIRMKPTDIIQNTDDLEVFHNATRKQKSMAYHELTSFLAENANLYPLWKNTICGQHIIEECGCAAAPTPTRRGKLPPDSPVFIG